MFGNTFLLLATADCGQGGCISKDLILENRHGLILQICSQCEHIIRYLF